MDPPDVHVLRRFGLTACALFLAFFDLLPLLRHRAPHAWSLIAGVLLIVPALLAPRLLELPYRGWMLLGRGLGWLNLRILLTALFFLVLTPLGVARRLFGKGTPPLAKGEGSYRKQSPRPGPLDRPY